MATPYRNRLWRTLAFCMVLGAAGLGAYYYLVQEPLQARYEHARQELSSLQEEIDARKAEEPTPTALPHDRLQSACKAYAQALHKFPQSRDTDAAIFAVEELARSAQLNSYRVAPQNHTDSPVSSAAQSRIALAFEGESLAIDRLIQNLQTYGKAGHIAALTLREVDDNEDDARARNKDTAIFIADATLDAYTVPNAAQLAADRCRELSVEE